MLTDLQTLLKEIVDLEKGLRRNDDKPSLKKVQNIKRRVKLLISQEIQK